MGIKDMKSGKDAIELTEKGIKELLSKKCKTVFVIGLSPEIDRKFIYIRGYEPEILLLMALEVINAVCEATVTHIRKLAEETPPS